MMRILITLCKHEFMQQMRHAHHLIVTIGFILTFLLLAVLGMGQEATAQAPVLVGLWWLGVLVALQITIPAFVVQDEAGGRLLQLQLLPITEGPMLLAKALALWCALVLPLVVLGIPATMLGGLEAHIAWRMAGLMLLASWAFWLISCSASLLLLGSARAAALQLLVALPLAVPLMIFGCASTLAAPEQAALACYLLAGIATAATAICPWIMGFLLRLHRAG